MIKRILFFTLLATASCKTSKLPPDKAVEKLGANPYFEIDGRKHPINQHVVDGVLTLQVRYSLRPHVG